MLLYRYQDAFNRILSQFSATDTCPAYDEASVINARYGGSGNPWHVGVTSDDEVQGVRSQYGGRVQAELELAVFLFGLVLQLKPHLVVETGCNIGTTTRALGAAVWANGFGSVVSCDVDLQMVVCARRRCVGLPVTIHACPALSLPDLERADLVFIDSVRESRMEEIKRVRPGAVYVMHDTMLYASVYRPVIEAVDSAVVHLDSPRGFSIVRKKE